MGLLNLILHSGCMYRCMFLISYRYGAAEADCLQALTLDPLYVKAYLRLGSAHFELQKFTMAKEDYEKALKLEPQNKTAQKELERIEKVAMVFFLMKILSL